MIKGGFYGKYLIVNLTDKSFKVEQLQEEIVLTYMGGRGIGARLLSDLQEAGVDALAPENNLILFSGPLNGTNAPGSSRLMFTTKSSLGNSINTTSMGGSYPNAVKKTGYDGIVISGKAADKTWIHISPDGVSFHSAAELWGLQASEAEEKIKAASSKKCHVACIGPAGEKLVRFAAIVSETRTAGRGGGGSVMGSKNLKAIAVSGNVKTPVADKEAFKEAVKKVRDDQTENPSVIGMQMNGTAGLIGVVNAMGALPTRNFQQGTFDAADDISGYAITEHNRVEAFFCQSCPVGCSLRSEIKSGAYKGTIVEGPEYESAVMLGSNLMIGNRDTICAANFLCDEYGLDTISTGNVIGFAMECYEKGLLTDKDTGGLKLEFGNDEIVLQLIKMIGVREGIGDRLAEGVKRLAEQIPGSEDFAMHVKGLEIAAYDPRAVFGQGLSYAIAPRGGEHGRGGYMIVEFFMPDVDLYTHEGKAERAAQMSEQAAMYDLSGLCSFNMVPTALVPELVNAVVGTSYSEDDVRELTRNTMTQERRFNCREGLTRADDTLPLRLLNEPLPDGMAAGKIVEGLDIMLDEYYAIRGWDTNGNPPAE
ncbi:MAG: aldehyde ferredoxin oxidoreductase family protein [Deltaproteobacteria bacterium]|nr:aldehyde ferredoxin oxidoreductase family protein [Deltaproteobacteria bacterium]